jgi:8-oxo-dGTP pyrophosphatase MutT (NUDIX family)
MCFHLPSTTYEPYPTMPRAAEPPLSSAKAVAAQYSGEDFVVGGGVAIFHIASERVVICSAPHHGKKYYFLPKGRRDAGEDSRTGAEREGYEEVHDLKPESG